MNTQFAKLISGITASALVWNFGATVCWSHPDHPVQVVSSDSALHYFIQPEHALPLVVFTVAIVWICRAMQPQLVARVATKKIIHVEDRRRG